MSEDSLSNKSLHQSSSKELLDFHSLNYALIYMHVLCLQYCMVHNILSAIVLFSSDFFQSFLSDGNSIYFQSYWLIKGLIFVILCGLLLIF